MVQMASDCVNSPPKLKKISRATLTSLAVWLLQKQVGSCTTNKMYRL